MRRIEWQAATIEQITVETPRVKTFTLRLSRPVLFRAGQHYDIRLTAPDGYQAQRSYSIASAPENQGALDFTIELIPDGEISPFFHQVVEIGDQIEIRGPIGGPFTWSVADGDPPLLPLLLIGGGSGIVPLMSMLRHRNESPGSRHRPEAALLYSSRTLADIIYRRELDEMSSADETLSVHHTITRGASPGWRGYSRRVDSEMIAEVSNGLGDASRAYICGPDGFVETAADLLVARGVPPESIHTERFGPSGPQT